MKASVAILLCILGAACDSSTEITETVPDPRGTGLEAKQLEAIEAHLAVVRATKRGLDQQRLTLTAVGAAVKAAEESFDRAETEEDRAEARLDTFVDNTLAEPHQIAAAKEAYRLAQARREQRGLEQRFAEVERDVVVDKAKRAEAAHAAARAAYELTKLIAQLPASPSERSDTDLRRVVAFHQQAAKANEVLLEARTDVRDEEAVLEEARKALAHP